MKYRLKIAKRDAWAGVVKHAGCATTLVPTISKNGYPKVGLTKDELVELEREMGMHNEGLALNSTYWTDYAKVMVPDVGEVELDDEIPEQRIIIAFLKEKPNVAQGLEQLAKLPDAEFVLYSKDEEDKKRVTANNIKAEAYKHYYQMAINEKRDMLFLYGVNSDLLNNDAVESQLFDQLDMNYRQFLEKARDKQLNSKVFVSKLERSGILTKKGTAYYHEEVLIGSNMEDTIHYIESSKNSGLKASLERLLTEKQSGGSAPAQVEKKHYRSRQFDKPAN